jgi:hypothetical protein
MLDAVLAISAPPMSPVVAPTATRTSVPEDQRANVGRHGAERDAHTDHPQTIADVLNEGAHEAISLRGCRRIPAPRHACS